MVGQRVSGKYQEQSCVTDQQIYENYQYRLSTKCYMFSGDATDITSVSVDVNNEITRAGIYYSKATDLFNKQINKIASDEINC